MSALLLITDPRAARVLAASVAAPALDAAENEHNNARLSDSAPQRPECGADGTLELWWSVRRMCRLSRPPVDNGLER
jgi:hypothetical protein